jgi:hypothetical protein
VWRDPIDDNFTARPQELKKTRALVQTHPVRTVRSIRSRARSVEPSISADLDFLIVGLYAAKNAVLVAARLKLGPTAARLFFHMALECWDDAGNPGGQPPRRYFGAREASAIALGFLAPANGSEAAFRAVKRATRELVDAGAIRRIRYGGNGHRAEFELNLDSSRLPNSRSPHLFAVPKPADQGTDYWSPQGASF